MKTVPDALIKLRQKQKDDTIVIVNAVIKELQDEGFNITVKNLVERTGFSRSLFSKPHIKALIPTCDVVKIQQCNALDIKQITELEGKLHKAQETIAHKETQISKLRNELTLKNEECEILRGNLHIIMQKCRINGFEIFTEGSFDK